MRTIWQLWMVLGSNKNSIWREHARPCKALWVRLYVKRLFKKTIASYSSRLKRWRVANHRLIRSWWVISTSFRNRGRNSLPSRNKNLKRTKPQVLYSARWSSRCSAQQMEIRTVQRHTRNQRIIWRSKSWLSMKLRPTWLLVTHRSMGASQVHGLARHQSTVWLNVPNKRESSCHRTIRTVWSRPSQANSIRQRHQVTAKVLRQKLSREAF